MAMAGVVFAVAGGLVLGAVLATESEHLDIDNLNWVWLVPLLTILFLTPSIVGATLLPTRAWTGGILIMGNAVLLLVAAASITPVALPLGIPYLSGLVLMWRAASRAIARRGSEEIDSGPRALLIWTAGGLAPILAFLLIASRLYENDCSFIGGQEICSQPSLGDEALVRALSALAIAGLFAVGLALLANLPADTQRLARWAAVFPFAGAALGLIGIWSPLGVIGLIALALVAISFVLFFLPTKSKEAA